MRKMFKAPDAEKEEVKDKQGAGTMPTAVIHVVATMENGQPVIRVEREVVSEHELKSKIEFWKGKTGHNELAVELDKNVPWKTFMAIQDAAAGAKIERTLRIERISSEEK
jgi:biopolymer transport protein ExbD